MPNVVGIKDSSGNMVNVMNLIEMTRKVDPDFKVLVGAEEILLPALLMGGKGCMTATAGILPEFMVGMYKAFIDKNFNLAYNLQFAILPLIREMKSVNFPQGFKEALSLRGINMGPPKMNYPESALAKIADLKARLEMEMASILDRYFPGMLLRYRQEDKTIAQKFSYPTTSNTSTDKAEKKFEDCTMCGMCNGDVACTITNGSSSISNTKEEVQEKQSVKSKSAVDNIGENIGEKDLNEIIAETVKKVLNQM